MRVLKSSVSIKLLGWMLAAAYCATLPARTPAVEMSTTANGVHFGIIGGKPLSPAPTVFFFGKGIEETLAWPGFNDALDTLGPGVLKVAVDGPCHGFERRRGEPLSLSCWRYRLEHGEDIMADLVHRASSVLDYLVRERYTDPAKVAAFGPSRGGFMALHFAAADSRVGMVAAFSPVTDLLQLQEFSGMQHEERARALAAVHLADALYKRPLWITIGGTDHRVSTTRAIEFTERIIETAEAHGFIPPIEMRILPADGHSTPDGAYAQAAQWFRTHWAGGNAPASVRPL